MTNLNSPIKYIAGIGPKYAEKLLYLGIETVRDLIYYLPSRYDDLSNIEKIENLKVDVLAALREGEKPMTDEERKEHERDYRGNPSNTWLDH